MGANDQGGVTNWTPGAWLAGFMQETTKHCYILNMLALGLREEDFKGSFAI